MTRPVRIDPQDGIHHVFSRGTRRWAIFLDDADRMRFMGLLGRVCERHGIRVIAFCLMDNHFHLVVQCPEGGLSASLRDLKSMYARYFNDRHCASGPVYERRFGSRLVTSHRQLRQLVRYVHRNPYAIDSCLDLASYRWSSHPIFLDQIPSPPWMHLSDARALFGDYRRDVERPIESDEVQNGKATSSITPLTAAPATPSIAAILIAVARSAGTELVDVHPSRRNGLIGIAALLAVEAGYTYLEMREPLGYLSSTAPASATSRTRKRLSSTPELATVLSTARLQLWPEAA